MKKKSFITFMFSTFLLPCCGNRDVSIITIPQQEQLKVDSIDYKPTPVNSSIMDYPGYFLCWHDEFDIDGRPSSDWSYEKGFVRNEELQWYQSDNAYVKKGCLVIQAKIDRFANPYYDSNGKTWQTSRKYVEYTSSCLTTQQSHVFKYGHFEVRAKIPTSVGAWPAIWLLGNQWDWPMNGEIDIMEYYLKDGRPSILANACWSGSRKWDPVWSESVTPFSHFYSRDPEWSKKFHVWSMDWDQYYIRIYLDNELLNEINLSETYNKGYNDNYENPFSNNIQEFGAYLLLNLAVGSNGGTPVSDYFPISYYIDYVRVYQKIKE